MLNLFDLPLVGEQKLYRSPVRNLPIGTECFINKKVAFQNKVEVCGKCHSLDSDDFGREFIVVRFVNDMYEYTVLDSQYPVLYFSSIEPYSPF